MPAAAEECTLGTAENRRTMTMLDLIIDTDPGVDDALAIMLAHAHPNVRLHALTVVAGNVGLHHTVANACKVLDVIQSDAKVYPGAARALVFEPDEDAAYVHGRDGLGDAGMSASKRDVETEHAANALVRMINERPGKLTLAAIGPLTNLALALHLDPELPSKTKHLMVMGGAVTGHGNVGNVTAEFNIYSDPEAAHLVFSQWPKFDLLDWEATVHHAFELDEVDKWLVLGTDQAVFFHAISRAVVAFNQGKGDGHAKMSAADALALAALVEPSVVEASEMRHVAIETHGRETRGQTVVDWLNRKQQAPNARIIQRVDQERFLALMQAGVGAVSQ
nr:non-specific ribonucleoside hydrolase RihC-like [Nerophis lumbriciformis]